MKIAYTSTTCALPWTNRIVDLLREAANAVFAQRFLDTMSVRVDASHQPEFSDRPGGILINDSVFIESRDYDVPRIGGTLRRKGLAVYIVADDGENPDLMLSGDPLPSEEKAAAAAILLLASNLIDRAIEGETLARVHDGYARAVSGLDQKATRLLDAGLRRSQ